MVELGGSLVHEGRLDTSDAVRGWRFVAAGAASVHRGRVAGRDARAARELLRARGLEVLELRPDRGGDARGLAALRGSVEQALRRRRGARLADALDGLGTLVRSGGSVPEALASLARERRTGDRALSTMLDAAAVRVREGESLAAVWRERREWFDAVDVALLGAGERTGELARVLERIVARRERAATAERRLMGALAYPAIVAVLAVGVMLFLGTKTLPDLVALLDGAGLEAPWLTARVIALAQLVTGHLAAFAVCVPFVVAGIAVAIESWRERGAPLPRLLHRLRPTVGRDLARARVSRGLAELLGAGVPWTDALTALKPAARHPELAAGLARLETRIREGASPAEAAAEEPAFGAELGRLLVLGERSGRMEALLEAAAERMERRAERAVGRLVLWLEPATILALAAVIGAVALAAVLPLVRLQQVIG